MSHRKDGTSHLQLGLVYVSKFFKSKFSCMTYNHIFKCMTETKFGVIFSSSSKNLILRHVSLASQKPNLCHIFKCILEIKFCVILSSAPWKLNFAETKYLKAHLRNQFLRHIFKLMETEYCDNVVTLATD